MSLIGTTVGSYEGQEGGENCMTPSCSGTYGGCEPGTFSLFSGETERRGVEVLSAEYLGRVGRFTRWGFCKVEEVRCFTSHISPESS